MFELEFQGAARTVTGSAHMLHIDGQTILLDCGLYQGRRAEAFERNSGFPFNPADIDVLILSHAHIDHSGKIPMLVKNGFTGPIFPTHATRDLANIMLLDSAHIQEKDAEFVNKKHREKGLPAVEPLYTMSDAMTAMENFQTVGYHRSIRVTDHVTVTFHDAGHILGSAIVVLDITMNGETKRICYTGDLGRYDRPIIRDPEFVGDVDVLISESTYGGRQHMAKEVTLDKLEDIITRTVVRGGKIIVPAFSVGRTQELVFDLQQLRLHDRLPDFPIYVDSPLSVNATQVFRIHPECMDPEIRDEILMRRDPFGFDTLTYITDVNESKELNGDKGPMMIISSSGMCEAGRILHHLANNIENPKNTVLITGYSAEHTLGRRIVEREPTVKIFGEEYALNAEVQVLNSLSGHADSNELMAYHEHFSRERLRDVFLVHGDYDQQQKLQARLVAAGFANVVIPEEGARFSF